MLFVKAIFIIMVICWLCYVSISNLELISSNWKSVISYIIIVDLSLYIIIVSFFYRRRPLDRASETFSFTTFAYGLKEMVRFLFFVLFVVLSFPTGVLIFEYLATERRELLISVVIGIILEVFLLLRILTIRSFPDID